MEVADIYPLFPDLTAVQKRQLEAMPALYAEWNEKVNLISRKDMDHFVERHLLHSLSLAFYLKPAPDQRILDIGTGGGFPGIPLAVLFPESRFVLADSIGKKVRVTGEVADALGLENVQTYRGRVEEMRGKYDFAVTRAVARLRALTDWCTRPKLKIGTLWCLKGGDLREEIGEIDAHPSVAYSLRDKLPGEFFDTKKVVQVRLR